MSNNYLVLLISNSWTAACAATLYIVMNPVKTFIHWCDSSSRNLLVDCLAGLRFMQCNASYNPLDQSAVHIHKDRSALLHMTLPLCWPYLLQLHMISGTFRIPPDSLFHHLMPLSATTSSALQQSVMSSGSEQDLPSSFSMSRAWTDV